MALRVSFSILLFFSIFPVSNLLAAKTITLPGTVTTSKTASTQTESADSIRNIENIIKTKTPSYISKPIIALVAGIEAARIQAGVITEKKSQELKKEVSLLKSSQKTPVFTKIFIQIEIFFVSLLSLILNTVWIFYTVFIVGGILALRYVWFLFLS